MSKDTLVVKLEQMKIVTAICKEVARQFPGIQVDDHQFNVAIAAANNIKAAFDGTVTEGTE